MNRFTKNAVLRSNWCKKCVHYSGMREAKKLTGTDPVKGSLTAQHIFGYCKACSTWLVDDYVARNQAPCYTFKFEPFKASSTSYGVFDTSHLSLRFVTPILSEARLILNEQKDRENVVLIEMTAIK